ncbi:hypothetical protein SAMN05444422_11124 [Halobiforma haloterrestris]|uniref:Uncharacterized protein n=1 Tax=Natronobacterium haloterrestre TaxID=148448 RepID=A0A1I1KBE2_NATHA|nr:hypothetical protein [Halobiforma haloterrestris]SFC58254.1 hypothetical protein SAMN05444422_11124 [Halobiforma haloterrestris]
MTVHGREIASNARQRWTRTVAALVTGVVAVMVIQDVAPAWTLWVVGIVFALALVVELVGIVNR